MQHNITSRKLHVRFQLST